MSKFDRCILISIAIGIWAFVLTNIFEPSTSIAHSDGHTHRYDEIVDFALVNSKNIDLQDRYAGDPVIDDGTSLLHAKIIKAEIADLKHPVRHTSEGLAREVLSLYHNTDRYKI